MDLLPGEDHLLWVGDTDAALTSMERFVDDVRGLRSTDGLSVTLPTQ
jgi:hypothetical protein